MSNEKRPERESEGFRGLRVQSFRFENDGGTYTRGFVETSKLKRRQLAVDWAKAHGHRLVD